MLYFQGWLVDLVNQFGVLGGFGILQERICGGQNLSVPLLAALLRFVTMFLQQVSPVKPFTVKSSYIDEWFKVAFEMILAISSTYSSPTKN